MSSQDTIDELTTRYELPGNLASSIAALSSHEIRDLAGRVMTRDMGMEELAAVIGVDVERLEQALDAPAG